MQLTNSGNIYFPTNDGTWISSNQQRIAEIIKDYDPNLELQWIPPGERSRTDYAFRVVDFRPGCAPYAILFAEEADERLLARLFAADNTRNGGTLNYLEAHNAALEAMRLKESMDSIAEATEMAASIARSKKIHYKHNGYDFGRVGGKF